MNAHITSIANMMATIIWIGMPNNMSKYTVISSIPPLFMRKLPVRKHRRKADAVNVGFSLVVITETGVSVRTPPAYVGRKSRYFYTKT